WRPPTATTPWSWPRPTGPTEPLQFNPADWNGPVPYVVAIRRDGTWYPSLSFTVTDWLLAQAEREHP
ncbi:MAG TPA: hypothetical protein VF880_20090, partial [Actinomycetes bacterium]